MQIPFDNVDRQIMLALQDNARLTTGDLAQMTGISQSPCWRRIKLLEDAGLITGYHVRLDRRALGHGVVAFVSVSLYHQNDTRTAEFVGLLAAIPEVVMCQATTGSADFLLMVVAEDLDAYSALLQGKLHRLPGVRQVQSSISLREFKGFGALPVPVRHNPP